MLVKKLRAPKWPEDVLPKIARGKAEKGRAIYDAQCAACHSPGTVQEGPLTLLALKTVPLAEIGTDPSMVLNWATRTVDMKGVAGQGEVSVQEFAFITTQRVMDFKYAEMSASPATRE